MLPNAVAIEAATRLVGIAVATAGVRGAIVIGFAATGTWLLRRRSAALRHSVWATAIAAQLVIPVVTPLMPAWRVAPKNAFLGPESPARARIEAAGPPSAAPVRLTAAAAPLGRRSSQRAFEWPSALVGVAVAAWLVGVLIRFGRLFVGTMLVARDVRHGVDVTDERPFADTAKLTTISAAGFRKARIVLTARHSVPFTCGILFPVVCLPAAARFWPNERLRMVMEHELVHVGRCDSAYELVLGIALAFYWFNPALWGAARHLRAEREAACDDMVLSLGARPSAYVTHLLSIIESATDSRRRGSVAAAMAHRSSLARRITAILDDRLDRSRGARLTHVALAASMSALALPLAALRGGDQAPHAAVAKEHRARQTSLPCRDKPRADRVARCIITIDSVVPDRRRVATLRAGPDDRVVFVGSDDRVVGVEARVTVMALSEGDVRSLAGTIHVTSGNDSIYAAGPISTNTRYWSVDYIVRVPTHYDVDASTTNGRVTVDGVNGTIRLTSVNGPIEIRHAGGKVHGWSTNGPIRVELSGKAWEGEGVFLESMSGPIALTIPRDFNAHLELGTLNGKVDVRVPIAQRGLRGNAIEADIGEAGPTIHLQTLHGSLTVR